MGIATALCAIMSACMACFNPAKTKIKATKTDDKIHVTYYSICCGLMNERMENISNVKDIEVLPIRNKEGIVVGYIAEISFASGASDIQLFKDARDNVVNDFKELSMFILGRDAKGNELVATRKGCCRRGGCYCVPCKNCGLVFFIMTLVVILWTVASFAIAFARDDTLFD